MLCVQTINNGHRQLTGIVSLQITEHLGPVVQVSINLKDLNLVLIHKIPTKYYINFLNIQQTQNIITVNKTQLTFISEKITIDFNFFYMNECFLLKINFFIL